MNESTKPSKAIVKLEGLSNLEVYEEVLGQRFMQAGTAEECKEIILLSKEVQDLAIQRKREEEAQKLADCQLQDSVRSAQFQRTQRVVASIVSVGIGLYCLPTVPLAGLLFLILGLAKPLGYSLGEVSSLLDGFSGRNRDSPELLADVQEDTQSKEPGNARP